MAKVNILGVYLTRNFGRSSCHLPATDRIHINYAFQAGHLAFTAWQSPNTGNCQLSISHGFSRLQNCSQWHSIVSWPVQADTGRMSTCSYLGGPEAPLETFNQINMYRVLLPTDPKIHLKKLEKTLQKT